MIGKIRVVYDILEMLWMFNYVEYKLTDKSIRIELFWN